MPDYSKGKIYCLRSFQTDDVYIGSTAKPLLTDTSLKRTPLLNGHNNFTLLVLQTKVPLLNGHLS